MKIYINIIKQQQAPAIIDLSNAIKDLEENITLLKKRIKDEKISKEKAYYAIKQIDDLTVSLRKVLF